MPLNLVNKREQVLFGKDSVVIAKYGMSIPGGRVLDTTGYSDEVIYAGHVIIRSSDGKYKPMPLTGSDGEKTYSTLPESHTYAGVLYRSILTAKPAASILIDGAVNEKALPYPITTIKSAFLAAVPKIQFVQDEPQDVPPGS